MPLFFVMTNVPSAWPTALSKPNGPSRWACDSPGSVTESPITNSTCPTAHPQNYLLTSTLSLYLCTATKKWPPSLCTNPVSIMHLHYSMFFLHHPTYIWPLHHLPTSTFMPILPGSVIRVLRHIRIHLPLLSIISLVPAYTSSRCGVC